MTSNPTPLFHPRREIGRTGFVATVLGIGDLADRALPIEQCVATARRAIDAGLNLIDTAPGYEEGYSEEIVAQAVKGVRDRIFVIDKIDHIDRSATQQVEDSLGRLQMDHVDLFVFHGLSSLQKWRQVAAPDGLMEELGRCVKAGKTRFRGISSHHPDVLREAITSPSIGVAIVAENGTERRCRGRNGDAIGGWLERSPMAFRHESQNDRFW